MVYFVRCAALVLALGIWLGLTPVWAQTDPEGLEFSKQLKLRFDDDDIEGFGNQVSANPDLTVRAFLSAVEFALTNLKEGNDEGGAEGFLLASLAARGLESITGDTDPNELLKLFSEEDPQALRKFVIYATGYVPAYEKTLEQFLEWFESGQTPPQESNYAQLRLSPEAAPPEYLQLIKPYLVKLQRFAMASAFAAPNLALEELETFGDLQTRVEDTIKEHSPSFWERFQTDFSYVTPRRTIARLRILAETGLLDEFNTELVPLSSERATTNEKLDLVYAGFRMALRQQRWSEADEYLESMRVLIDRSQERVSPVFPYVLETGRRQVRYAKGEEFSISEWLAAFNSAWDKFEDYQPIVRVEDDITWHLTRGANHFWIDRLSELPDTASADAILRISGDSQRWVSTESSFQPTLETLTDELALFHSEQLQGYLTVALANLDTLIYALERWKPVLADPKSFAEASGSFSESLKGIQAGAQDIARSLALDGDLALELERSDLLTELEARSLYLIAIDPTNSTSQKISKLKIAAEKFEAVAFPESYIDYHLLLGRQFLALEQSQLALNAWERAYRLAKARNFVGSSIEAATLLAREYGHQRDWDKAHELASEASELIEQQLDGSKTRVGRELAKLNESLVEVQARAAIQADKPELALAAITRNQQLQSANVQLEANPEASAAASELNSKKQQLAVLSDKVRELQELPVSSIRDELLTKTQKLLAQTKSEFLLQSRTIRQKFSRLYTTALRFDPLNLPDVQQALTEGTAVVQYFPTDDELFIFVVTPDKFRLRSVAQGKNELDRLISSYLKDLRTPFRSVAPMTERSKRLYEILISPIEEDIANSDTLVLISAGQLNFLPYASLLNRDSKYLLEEKVLLELAKPTDFLKIATSTPKRPGRVVAFANATLDLPAAEQEGRSIAALFPGSKLFTRAQANKKNLLEFGGQADVLHFATHGVWDSSDSSKNHLELADGQSLAQEEIFGLTLEGTSIVTLSACNTAMGDSIEGKYVASLAEAFWIAGSRTVVASLWQVDDSSTSKLMTEFYENLRDGKAKGESLRDAQLNVLATKEFQHPYYWSGFSMFGDYR